MANFTPQEIEQFLQEFFDVVGTRQYTGARYVPIFGRRGESDIYWNNSADYEPLTIVLFEGDSYTSKRYVPKGIDILNTDYWVVTGRYNAQVEQYRQQVLGLEGQIDANTEAISEEHEAMLSQVNGLREDVDNDYVPFPDETQHSKYGVLGQVLSTLSNGGTLWTDPVTITSEIAGPIIQAWLNDHPEATTTVADGSVTDAKLVQSNGVLQAVANIEDSALFNSLQIKLDSTTANGVSFVNNGDGTVTLTGTATAQTTFILENDRTPRSGAYSLFGVPTGASGWYVQCDGIGRDSGSGASVQTLLTPYFGNTYIRISNGTTFPDGGVTFRPVITKTTLTKGTYPTISPVNMLLEVWNRTNVKIVQVNSSNYASALPDANNAASDTIYELVFSISDGSIPQNLPVKHILGTNATLMTIGNVNGLYASQIFIMSSAVFRRVRSSTGYSDWKVIAGTYTDYVGPAGRFFTSIKDALEAVDGLGTPSNHVRLEVDAGTYDLLSEMGGDTFLARIDGSSGNRNGLAIPTYVDVVGIGNVTLSMVIPDNKSTNYTVEKISAIEVFGECTLENLNIVAKNCRYCIHDETGGSTAYSAMRHIYKHVNAHHMTNTHAGWVSQDAFGAGVSRRNTYLFENCVFKSDEFTAFGLHNNTNASECTIIFDGVTLDGEYTFIQDVGPVCSFISYYGTNTLTSDIIFKNINASGKFMIKQETSQVPSDDIYVVYNYSNVEIVRS